MERVTSAIQAVLGAGAGISLRLHGLQYPLVPWHPGGLRQRLRRRQVPHPGGGAAARQPPAGQPPGDGADGELPGLMDPQQGQYVQKILHNIVAPGIGFQLPQEAGVHPGVAAALHVEVRLSPRRRQSFCPPRPWRQRPGRRMPAPASCSPLFGDEHAVEVCADAGISKPYLLGEGVAVGDGVELRLALDGV